MEAIELTTEMLVVLGLLGFTVFLFVSEILRVDVAAVLVMVILGALSYLPGLGGVADINHLFDGFASNAVISIIAVMIIGAGLDKTGVMSTVAAWIMRVGGATERRIIALLAGAVGVISSFMQNVGAAALFLPVSARISARTEIPLSRLLMPMGFCAILGGTITMVGSSPLILLNDLIETVNDGLPEAKRMATFELFSVAPIGLALLGAGILYFTLFGRFVLPARRQQSGGASGRSITDYLNRIYGLDAAIHEVSVPVGSWLEGATLAEISEEFNIQIVGTYFDRRIFISPLLATRLTAPCKLAVMGDTPAVEAFTRVNALKRAPHLDAFAEEFAPSKSGVAELVIPPYSSLIGKTFREIGVRRTYGLSVLAIHRGEETLSHVETPEHPSTRINRVPLQAGDTLVAHVSWSSLTQLEGNRDFVIVTADYPREELRPQKVVWALVFFLAALALILFTDVRLSLALLVGAIGMIISRVITIDEAYRAVGWSSVFLLASLIPLGQAVQSTGTAEWIAAQILIVLGGAPIWVLQAGIAVLATAFTLVMSNVGATVLLVPLAVNIAMAADADPAVFALTVAIATSNSFLIPTHQVNALIMGPAGYRVIDFVKSGGVMTILFLVVSLGVLSFY